MTAWWKGLVLSFVCLLAFQNVFTVTKVFTVPHGRAMHYLVLQQGKMFDKFYVHVFCFVFAQVQHQVPYHSESATFHLQVYQSQLSERDHENDCPPSYRHSKRCTASDQYPSKFKTASQSTYQ